MDRQKRKKHYFNQGSNQKKHKQLSLEVGMTGFLCTCNFREKDCIRDAYKILNEFSENSSDLLEPHDTHMVIDGNMDQSSVPDEEDDNENDHSDEDDILTTLNKEITDLKAEYHKPVSLRKFQVANTGVKNVIFIKSSLQNRLELVTKIVKELDRTKQQRTRFLLRLIPIEVVCRANMNDIKTKAQILFEKYFSQEPKTFCIVFNRHSSNTLHRDEVIQDLAEIISKKNPGNKADLKNPELAVIVEVIRGVCLISIAPDYFKYKKYNLLEICNVKQHKEGAEEKNNVGVQNKEKRPEKSLNEEGDLKEEENPSTMEGEK